MLKMLRPVLISLGLLSLSAQATELVTLKVLTGSAGTASEILVLAQGESAALVYDGFAGATSDRRGYLEISFPEAPTLWLGCPLTEQSAAAFTRPVIAGPASIRLVRNYNPTYVTFSVNRPAPLVPVGIPANAAVIPEDSEGNYQVILESSTDTVTWSPAMPGNYGGTTVKRFFRTRIVKVTE